MRHKNGRLALFGAGLYIGPMPRWEVPYESPDRTLLRYGVGTVFALTTRDGHEIETPIWRAGSRIAHRNRTKLPRENLSRSMERLRAEARLNT